MRDIWSARARPVGNAGLPDKGLSPNRLPRGPPRVQAERHRSHGLRSRSSRRGVLRGRRQRRWQR
eukprot:4540136-Alexandrium_andersonii.AAC.1